MLKFHEKAVYRCDPVDKEALVNVCYMALTMSTMSTSRICHFSPFFKLMEAAKRTNGSLKRAPNPSMHVVLICDDIVPKEEANCVHS